MLREGERNRTRDGLQQSYGDHNRLLMLALDRLLAGDVEWLRAHAADPDEIDAAALRQTAARAKTLPLSPEVRLALWLGAALHDCGMLCGQGAYVDVEDGLVLARDLIAEYCPADTRPLAEFALRHHDYIKDVFLGEVPAAMVETDLDALGPDRYRLGLVALGLIQVAGASSLGEGRLTTFRLRIFSSCYDGLALADDTPGTRLARLLGPSPEGDVGGASPPVDIADRAPFAECPDDLGPDLLTLLESTAVHGWHRFARGADGPTRLRALRTLARHNRWWRADHLVIHDSLRAAGDGVLPSVPHTDVHVALSGATIVTVRGEPSEPAPAHPGAG